MKKETAIRRHIADLEWTHALPCNCLTPDEKEECRISRLLIRAAIGALAWVVGDHPGWEEVVRELSQRHKAGEGLPCHAGPPPIQKEI